MVQRQVRSAAIDALLDFTPAPHKCARRDGWTPERQRGFIALLAATGSAERAAQAVGMTARGAYDLRKRAGADGFARAWDAALAEWSRGGASADIATPAQQTEEGTDERREGVRDIGELLIHKYRCKVQEERNARLQGRIVEADFCVRQLTWLEVACELTETSYDLYLELKRGKLVLLDIAATPMSMLLGEMRRSVWREKGEPERPPASPIGQQIDGVSVPRNHFRSGIDGDYNAWFNDREVEQAIAAEANRLWEERARAEAAEWAARNAVGEAEADGAA